MSRYPLIAILFAMTVPTAARDVHVTVEQKLDRETRRQQQVAKALEANRSQMQRIIDDLRSNGLAEQWGAERFERMATAVKSIEDKPLPDAIAALRAAHRDIDNAKPHIADAAGHVRLIERQLAELLAAAEAMQRRNAPLVDRTTQKEQREKLEAVADQQRQLRKEVGEADRDTFARDRSQMQAEQEQIAGELRSVQRDAKPPSASQIERQLVDPPDDQNPTPGQQGGEAHHHQGQPDASQKGDEGGKPGKRNGASQSPTEQALDEAHEAMREAARRLGKGDQRGATQSQKKAEQAVRTAMDRLDEQIAEDAMRNRPLADRQGPNNDGPGGQLEGDSQAGANKPNAGQANDQTGDADGQPVDGDGPRIATGNGTQGGGNGGAGGGSNANAASANWQPLADDQRNAVYGTYLRELPVEYREMLEQYYEVLSE